MRKELREEAAKAAAARYGAEHYRGILLLGTLRNAWPVIVPAAVLALLVLIGWKLKPSIDGATRYLGNSLWVIGLVILAVMVGWLLVRRARSPYRRRRFHR